MISVYVPAHSCRKISARFALRGVKVALNSAGVDIKPSHIGIMSWSIFLPSLYLGQVISKPQRTLAMTIYYQLASTNNETSPLIFQQHEHLGSFVGQLRK